MKVMNTRVCKRAEFYLSREKRNRKAPIFMGGGLRKAEPLRLFV
jgi:hypothetical protein